MCIYTLFVCSSFGDEAYYAVLEAKYARIIEAISELHSVSLDEAVNILTQSTCYINKAKSSQHKALTDTNNSVHNALNNCSKYCEWLYESLWIIVQSALNG